MKEMCKTLAIMGVTAAAVGGGVYLMQNKNARKQAGQKMIKAMNDAESMIAKKMN